MSELSPCPECGHEWAALAVEEASPNAAGVELSVIMDTAGNILQDGFGAMYLKSSVVRKA